MVLSLMQSGASFPDAAAAQAFIFLINFNARKKFRFCPLCYLHATSVRRVGVTLPPLLPSSAPGTALRRVVRTSRSLFLANNQIAQTATETETARETEREGKQSEVLVDCLSFVSQ